MKRIHYLAAEIFFYSYDNYDNHLGVNERFDRLMPNDAKLLDAALDGPIDAAELARRLEVDEDELIGLLDRAKRARKIVDAPSPAAAFREAVKQSIAYAVKEGIGDAKTIESLTSQICYRAADLSFVLEKRDSRLAQYSEELRHEND
jgi:hypothetical protein